LRDWLTDMVLEMHEQIAGGRKMNGVGETRSSLPTEQQLVDYFIFDAEDVDRGNFSRAKTNEVAAHFGIPQDVAFRALDALARRDVLTKTRDIMKKHRGKTAVGYQWWEYYWRP